MKTLTTTIKNAKSKVMRTAWHLFKSTGVSFSESLKAAWKIIKDTFSKVETEKGMCFLEDGARSYRKVARDAKEVNKEVVASIVFLTNHFKRMAEIAKAEAEKTERIAEIRRNNPAIIADHLIYNSSLD